MNSEGRHNASKCARLLNREMTVLGLGVITTEIETDEVLNAFDWTIFELSTLKHCSFIMSSHSDALYIEVVRTLSEDINRVEPSLALHD